MTVTLTGPAALTTPALTLPWAAAPASETSEQRATLRAASGVLLHLSTEHDAHLGATTHTVTTNAGTVLDTGVTFAPVHQRERAAAKAEESARFLAAFH